MNNQSIIDANILALRDGIELMIMLDTQKFRSGFRPAFQASIGAHYRHIIEHYRCLLMQIGDGEICYDDRQRDEVLENDREYALNCLDGLIEQLDALAPESWQREYKLIDQVSHTPLITTLQRELLFLHSHTVHHYAIIAAMARGVGVQPKTDFGVAIATIRHNKESTTRETQEDLSTRPSNEGNLCAQ